MSAKGHRPPTVRQMPDGVWYSRASLGYDRVTGRQIRPFRRFPGATTREEAQRQSDEWFWSIGRVVADAGSTRLSEMLPYFVRTMPARTRANTRRQYMACAKRLVPVLGGIEFDRLRTMDIDIAMVKLGGEYGPATLGQTRAFLGAAYTQWVGWGLVDVNPVRGSEPQGGDGAGADHALDEGAMLALDRALLADMAGHRSAASRMKAAAAWVSLRTGLRRGEVCGLRLSDWDAVAGRLHVRGTVVRAPSGLARQPPKTKTSRRTVALARDERDTLAEFVGWRLREFPARSPTGPDPLLCSARGGVIDPDGLTRWFHASLRRYGLPEGVRFHDLRHTAATLCLGRGGNVRVLQQRLGHADARTTLRNYAEVMPGMDEECAESTASAFRDGPRREAGDG